MFLSDPERDGRGEGGQTEIHEVGGQLDAQIGGLPCPTPSCKPAGGRREVKTRLEEPGGGWRMEVLYNPFDFMQDCLIFNQFGKSS